MYHLRWSMVFHLRGCHQSCLHQLILGNFVCTGGIGVFGKFGDYLMGPELSVAGVAFVSWNPYGILGCRAMYLCALFLRLSSVKCIRHVEERRCTKRTNRIISQQTANKEEFPQAISRRWEFHRVEWPGPRNRTRGSQACWASRYGGIISVKIASHVRIFPMTEIDAWKGIIHSRT